MTPFQLTTTPRSGRTWIVVSGELDIATAPDLESELRARLDDPDAGELVLDLSPVTFIDSSGLRAVLLGSREARAAGRRLVVCPGTGQAMRVLELAQVVEHLDLGDERG